MSLQTGRTPYVKRRVFIKYRTGIETANRNINHYDHKSIKIPIPQSSSKLHPILSLSSTTLPVHQPMQPGPFPPPRSKPPFPFLLPISHLLKHRIPSREATTLAIPGMHIRLCVAFPVCVSVAEVKTIAAFWRWLPLLLLLLALVSLAREVFFVRNGCWA